MDPQRIGWRRTSLTVAVVAAVMFAPALVAKARNDNWNVNDVTSRMPWHDPQLAGEITTDHAAAAACSTVPTFDVSPDGDGALLSYGGPLSLEQANARPSPRSAPPAETRARHSPSRTP